MTKNSLVFKPATLDAAPATSSFVNPVQLAGMLDAWGVLPGETYFREHVLRIVPDVSRTLRLEISRYLAGELTLPDMAAMFLAGFRATQVALSRDRVIEAVSTTAVGVDNAVKRRLSAVSLPPQVNLFAYGLGDGSYEEALRDWLLDSGACEQVSMFGFDPNAQLQGRNIRLIDLNELDALPAPDIFLARWVLHHVPYAERWAALLSILNRMRQGSVALIAEEGVFAVACELSVAQRAYALLFAILDILINAAVHPLWIEHGEFFIDYLSERDLEGIEAALDVPVRRSSIEVDCDFLREVLLVYEF
ncbi:MAG: hypothetical protein AAGA91_01880 [Pseudomonadota bacterium]